VFENDKGATMFRVALIAIITCISLATPVLTTAAQALPTFERDYVLGDCYRQWASFTRGGISYRYLWGYVCY